MVASEQTSQRPAPARRAAEHSKRAPSDGANGAATAQVHQLLDRAAQLRLHAPELARVLGQRAAALAESAGSNTLWIHAEALVVLTTIRLGHRAGTVGRAVAVLRAAEDAGEDVVAVRLRTALAVCARSVGVPLTGLAVLRPALSGAGVPGAHRAAALGQLAGCVAGLAGKPELDRTFAQADRLCSEDGTLTGDAKLVQRALLRVGMSAHRRRHGDLVGAADAARTGIGFLDGLEDAAVDGGVARSRLALELVTSLLGRGETAVAFDVAAPILARPLRAAEIAPVGWLRLAVATRVHLAAGAGYAATRLLRDAVHDTDRHSMRALSARLRSELAHVEERMGRPVDALETLRGARADERAHARLRGRAYAVLTSEFGAGDRPRLDFAEILGQSGAGGAAPRVAEVGEPTKAQHAGNAEHAEDTENAEARPAAMAQRGGAASQAPTHHTPGGGARRAGQPEAGGSVLDRLGITTGSAERSGGRRRANDTPDPEPERADALAGEWTAPGDAQPAGEAMERASDAEGASAATEQDDWLPRLRLPPSLAPIEEMVSAASEDPGTAETFTEHRVSDDDIGSRTVTPLGDHSTSVGQEVARDEPAADAGLAELLTRALAEHQAGNSSAAALVKRLGAGSESEEPPRVNGRHRGDD